VCLRVAQASADPSQMNPLAMARAERLKKLASPSAASSTGADAAGAPKQNPLLALKTTAVSKLQRNTMDVTIGSSDPASSFETVPDNLSAAARARLGIPSLPGAETKRVSKFAAVRARQSSASAESTPSLPDSAQSDKPANASSAENTDSAETLSAKERLAARRAARLGGKAASGDVTASPLLAVSGGAASVSAASDAAGESDTPKALAKLASSRLKASVRGSVRGLVPTASAAIPKTTGAGLWTEASTGPDLFSVRTTVRQFSQSNPMARMRK
jgi:hypothetical protein